MTTTQELIELADEYARCNANHHVEDMYGTSKGYTAECKSFSDEARARLLQAIESLSAEVGRLRKELSEVGEQHVRFVLGAHSVVCTERDQLRAQIEAQGEVVPYWSEVIGMFVERLNNGPQTTAASDVLALLNDCQYLASLSTHPAPAAPVVEPKARGFDIWWQDFANYMTRREAVDAWNAAQPVNDALHKALTNLHNATNILQSYLNGNTSQQLAQASVNAFNEYLDAALHPTKPKGEKA